MTKDCCTYETSVLTVRATEKPDVWGRVQVFECVRCGRRWSE